jgi:peptidoglycan/xylan/chitin deacetylase (PgdA/CDA1 family)
MNKIQHLWIVFFMGITFCASAQRVIIHFDSPLSSTPALAKASLRYDKDFAYSLTFDDGGIDAYTCALPILSGGTACNGVNFPGLSFTDGCGNSQFFKAGLAWNGANALGLDAHDGRTVGKMTWQQLDAVYDNGWDVLNHSFSHKSRSTHTLTSQDYITEIEANRPYVRDRTRNKIEMPLFVVPSGDVNYQSMAYSRGQKLVFDQAGTTIGVGGLSVKSDFIPNGQVIHRQLLEDALNSGVDKIGAVANKSINGEKIWYNEFTHSLNGSTGLTFDNFKKHLDRIANTWGKNGTDRVWMASLQEVYEYLTVRKNITYTATIKGNQLILDFDMSQLPDWLRRKHLTLVVNSGGSFSKIEVPQNMKMSFNGTGTKKIINLDFTGVAPSKPCDFDTTPPILSNCPQNISLSTTGVLPAATWFAPNVSDNCGVPILTSNFISGQKFPIGNTTVIYTATDAKNNTATCRFTISVTKTVVFVNPCDTDKIPPVFTVCPKSNIVATTTGTSANVNFTPLAATDNCSTPSVFGSHQPNQVFQIGSTYVGYTARDAKGNEAYCNFYVVLNVVQDIPKKADLALSIKASSMTYSPWVTDTFTITVKNNGGVAMTNIKIDFKYPNKTTNGGTVSTSKGVWREFCPGNIRCFEWSIDNLAANQTATLVAPLFILDAAGPLVATPRLLSSLPLDEDLANNQASISIQPAVSIRRSANIETAKQYVPLVIQDISPNPTEGDILVNITSLVSQNIQFDFYNILGKSVFSEIKGVKAGENQLNFNLSDINSGIYIIKSSIGEGRNAPLKVVKF